jgi:hypothetical protein
MRGRLLDAAGVAWLLVSAGLLLFLFLGDDPDTTRFWAAVFDFGHTPMFGTLALAVLHFVRARRPDHSDRHSRWTAFGLTVAVGAVTELLQFIQPSRDPSLEDLARDAAGAASFLLMSPGGAEPPGRAEVGGGRRRRQALAAVSVALVLAAGAHLLSTAVLYVERDAAMPTLFRMDGSWWEQRLIGVHDATLLPGSNGGSAGIELRPALYPGITFSEPYPDWRAFRQLSFSVSAETDTPIALTIRIDDAWHDNRYLDRFNRSVKIPPGGTRVVIRVDDIRRAPDRREMDLAHIRRILLFAYKLQAPVRIHVGPLRLE